MAFLLIRTNKIIPYYWRQTANWTPSANHNLMFICILMIDYRKQEQGRWIQENINYFQFYSLSIFLFTASSFLSYFIFSTSSLLDLLFFFSFIFVTCLIFFNQDFYSLCTCKYYAPFFTQLTIANLCFLAVSLFFTHSICSWKSC